LRLAEEWVSELQGLSEMPFQLGWLYFHWPDLVKLREFHLINPINLI